MMAPQANSISRRAGSDISYPLVTDVRGLLQKLSGCLEKLQDLLALV